jgi:uncharacterized protein (TIGR02594 family)
MASILDIELPEERPTGAPGNDYFHINSSPNMFGGYQARAGEAFGQSLEKAGETGLSVLTERQRMVNDIHSADVNTWYADQVTDKYSKFSQLEGRAANDALPQFKKDIDDLRQQAQSRAGSLAEQAKLAASLRYLQDSYYRYATNHADGQMRTWQSNTAKNQIETYAGQAAVAYGNGDMQGFENALRWQDNEVRNWASLHGEEVEAAVTKRRGATLKAIIDTQADLGKLKEANELFDRYKDRMDPVSVAQVTAKLKGQNTHIQAIDWVDRQTAIPHSPMDVARQQVGLREDKDRGVLASFIKNVGGQNIDPALTPWCAAWANAVLHSAGYSGTNSAAARSFLTYGTPVDQPQEGDIVVLSRGADPAKGHVGFYAGPGSTPGTIKILGGNQGNAVSVAEFPTANVLGYRRLSPNDVANNPPPLGPGPAAFVQQNKGAAVAQALDDPALRDNPMLRNAVITEINHRYTVQQAAYLDQERDRKQREEALKDAQKAGTDELLNGLINNDPSWTAQRIMADPRFAYNREHALGLLQAKAAGQKDVGTYGQGFYDLFKRIHLPDGNPNKITAESQLYEHSGPNGDLTLAGLKELRTELSSKRTPEGEAESVMRAQFLKTAKNQISGSDEGLHLKDPKGDELYQRFLAQFFPAYQKGKQDGKTAFQMLDPGSPDYLGKSIAQFKRPMSQWTADMLAAANGASQAAPDLNTPQGLISAVQSGKMTRAEGEKLALERGWIRTSAQPPSNEPQVPQSR